MNAKSNNNADQGDQLHAEIVQSVEQLEKMVNQLSDLVKKPDGISEKVKGINLKIQAIQANERNATELDQKAQEKFDEVSADYEAEKTKDAFSVGDSFVEKVEDLRETQNKAFILQDNVQKLMEEVNNYKAEWMNLQMRHKEIKQQVDKKKVTRSF